MKKALIVDITGQDGSYLTETLLNKGYEVHGIVRRSSSFNTERIDHLGRLGQQPNVRLFRHFGDLTDASSLQTILTRIRPDEVYNLGAQSRVIPEYTGEVTGLGTIRLLEAIRQIGLGCRFYQASSSEMYGSAPAPQSEATPFHPRSPYAAAKAYAFHVTQGYREAYGMHASNGILFNHESPVRGETFVTRKITRALARIALGLQDCVHLGNLSAQRDWGHARDYVDAMWRMLQQPQGDDYVIATGVQHSVRDFIALAAAELGLTLAFEGEGLDEVARVSAIAATEGASPRCRVGDVIVRVDPRYFRPTEVETLLGDASKARERLGWTPSTSIETLVREMMAADYSAARRDELVKSAGFPAYDAHE